MKQNQININNRKNQINKVSNVYFSSICNNDESDESSDEEEEDGIPNAQWCSDELKNYFLASNNPNKKKKKMLNPKKLTNESVDTENANLLTLSNNDGPTSSAMVITLDDINKSNQNRRNKLKASLEHDEIYSCSSTSENCSNDASLANSNPSSVKNLKEFDDDDDIDGTDEEENENEEENEDEEDDENENEEDEEDGQGGLDDLDISINENHIKDSINSVVNNENGKCS